MHYTIKLTVWLLILNSCSPSKFLHGDIQGRYIQDKNNNISMTFSGNAFAFVDKSTNNDLALYTCCDTITYGLWGLDNSRDFLYLNSADLLNRSILSIQVAEKKINETDTLYFSLNNPIEQHYKLYNTKNRDIYYRVAIDTRNFGFLNNVFLIRYDTNLIKIPKPKGAIVDKFSIFIYPKSNFGGRNIGTFEVTTLEHQVQETSANVFEVNIPLLDYGYLSYIRLNKDFVKIINKNKLEWDGHTYSK